MEFTPKKSKSLKHALRHNPYTSGGRKYIGNYKKFTKDNSFHATPRDYKNKNVSNDLSNYKPRCLTRTERILHNSQIVSSQKENLGSNTKKDSFLNLDEDDNLTLLSDSDDETGIINKSLFNDKENIHKKPTLKVYPRKKFSNIKSRIASDISPEKIELAYRKNFYSAKLNSQNEIRHNEEKENRPSNSKSSRRIEFPHSIGFPNYGNTCYLNAVLQSLVGLSCFTQDVGSILKDVNIGTNTISLSFWNTIINRQKRDIVGTKQALRSFKENFEKVDFSFSGSKMQDANEFLIRLLDAIKDEIDNKISSLYKSQSASHKFGPLRTPENSLSTNKFVSKACDISSSPDVELNKIDNINILDTPNSQDSETSLGLKSIEHGDIDDFEVTFKKDPRKNVLSPNCDNLKSVVKSSEGLLAMYLVTPAKSSPDENNSDIRTPLFNPVKQNFEFELQETYTCLGCNHVAGKKQHHFALYVNLPKEGQESIQEAVESYIGKDQRDLTCEKCAHKTVSVLTTFNKYPRILIVQMKRYEYKSDLQECIKVSSKVNVNLWLHLSSLSSESFLRPPDWSPQPILSRYPLEKPSTLSVRNLSSDLNCCDTVASPLTEQDSEKPSLEISASNEEDTLQEVMRRSIDDQGGVTQTDKEKEEEELQRAIQLSLQDIGMTNTFNNNCPSDDDEIFLKYNCDETTTSFSHKVEDEETHGPFSYRLTSVISHFGLTTSTGHYVADVYNCKEKCWYHYDDELVSKVSDNIMLANGRKKNGYIFFYVHNSVFQQLCNEKAL